jgi:hypothetical protein
MPYGAMGRMLASAQRQGDGVAQARETPDADPRVRWTGSREGDLISPPSFQKHASRRTDGLELPEQPQRATNATYHAERSGIRSDQG